MLNKSTSIIIFGSLLFVTVLTGCGGSSSSSGTAASEVTLSPSSGIVNLGESFSQTIEVLNIGETFLVAFDLTYDPNVIEFVSGSEGPFLSRSGVDPTSFQIGLQDEVAGRLIVGLTRLGPIGNISGSGVLLTLTFNAVGIGSSSLIFEQPRGLRDNALQDVAIDTWQDDMVIVQ